MGSHYCADEKNAQIVIGILMVYGMLGVCSFV